MPPPGPLRIKGRNGYPGVSKPSTSILAFLLPYPIALTTARPRVLIGSGTGTSSETGADGSFQFSNYNLVLQLALTIDANNNDKSVGTVIGELSAKLQTLGFQLPPVDM